MSPNLAGRRFAALGVASLLLTTAGAAAAHHSFAVFFSAEKEVQSLTGTVKAFRFTNPHGFIDIAVKAKNGTEEAWRAETNSPSILLRRGWTKDSLKPGEVVTVSGWPARDGSKYLRMRSVNRADGSLVGAAIFPTADKP